MKLLNKFNRVAVKYDTYFSNRTQSIVYALKTSFLEQSLYIRVSDSGRNLLDGFFVFDLLGGAEANDIFGRLLQNVGSSLTYTGIYQYRVPLSIINKLFPNWEDIKSNLERQRRLLEYLLGSIERQGFDIKEPDLGVIFDVNIWRWCGILQFQDDFLGVLLQDFIEEQGNYQVISKGRMSLNYLIIGVRI